MLHTVQWTSTSSIFKKHYNATALIRHTGGCCQYQAISVYTKIRKQNFNFWELFRKPSASTPILLHAQILSNTARFVANVYGHTIWAVATVSTILNMMRFLSLGRMRSRMFRHSGVFNWSWLDISFYDFRNALNCLYIVFERFSNDFSTFWQSYMKHCGHFWFCV